MKTFIKNISLVLVVALFVISCNNSQSLQKYYVDSKENDAFLSVDIPASILQLKDTEISEDVKNTLKTIKKINFLALQLTDSNEELYNSEKAKVKAILKNEKYKQLMRMNLGTASVSVNYLGEEDAIDEMILFGSDNEKGFAIARVIGENMNPSDIIELSKDLKLDGDSSEMKQLKGLLSNIK